MSEQWPPWVATLASTVTTTKRSHLTSLVPHPDDSPTPAAVLMLFSGHSFDDASVLLVTRAGYLRAHAGQVAFPGGRVEPGDASPTATALREAQEETGLTPTIVSVVGTLPPLWIPVSNYQVTPVVAWAAHPEPVHVADPGELVDVGWLALSELSNPAHRFSTVAPSGWVGPAFEVGPHFIWGFTAGLLSRFLDRTKLAPAWDPMVRRPLPPQVAG